MCGRTIERSVERSVGRSNGSSNGRSARRRVTLTSRGHGRTNGRAVGRTLPRTDGRTVGQSEGQAVGRTDERAICLAAQTHDWIKFTSWMLIDFPQRKGMECVLFANYEHNREQRRAIPINKHSQPQWCMVSGHMLRQMYMHDV